MSSSWSVDAARVVDEDAPTKRMSRVALDVALARARHGSLVYDVHGIEADGRPITVRVASGATSEEDAAEIARVYYGGFSGAGFVVSYVERVLT